MLIGGMIILLAFVTYMFDFFRKTAELELIKKDMYFDSLILIEQKELRKKDSIFEIKTTLMDSFQNEIIKKKLNKKDREKFEEILNTIP
jgi:hypothetical protein